MKTKILLLWMICMLWSMQTHGKILVDGIYYNFLGKNATVTSANNGGRYDGNVVIPETVIYSGIAYSVTSIGDNAFSYSGLTSITIPNSVTSIGNDAFYNCTGLKSITIPNGVKSIGNYAFNSSGLTSIMIPNGVVSIGNYAFSHCFRLTSITIPSSVTSIGDLVFDNCSVLKEFIVSEQNQNYSTIDGVLFSKDKNVLINYPNAKSSKYSIPNNVDSIGFCAFFHCSGLTSITIPSSVNSIGDYAFSHCSGLKEIYTKNPIPLMLGNSALYYVDKTTCILYVPKGSKINYQSANQWKNFTNIIEEDNSSIESFNLNGVALYSIPNGIRIETIQPIAVSIFNISGHKLYQSAIDSNTDIDLLKGIYILQINTSNGTITKKVMKQ